MKRTTAKRLEVNTWITIPGSFLSIPSPEMSAEMSLQMIVIILCPPPDPLCLPVKFLCQG